ncbi:MAG: hypothetical protein U0271_16240 [Polyangiaceae bacterium]
MKRLSLMVFVFAALTLMGCGPKWKIVSQAEPNPLVGQTDFVVQPIDYTDLLVGKKTEQEYLSGKKDKSVESFEGDKAGMNDKFADSVQAAGKRGGLNVSEGTGDANGFVLRPHITFLEPGYNAVISKAPSKVVLVLRIENKDGKLVDEVEFKEQTSAGLATGTRYRDCAQMLGKQVIEYIKKRVKGV